MSLQFFSSFFIFKVDCDDKRALSFAALNLLEKFFF